MAVLDAATNMLGGGFTRIFSYAWVLIPVVVIISIILIAWWVKKIRSKEDQWTHKLRVRRVLPGGRVSDPIFHRMRRFPLIKKAEVFELEEPLLGGYLCPELDEYSGENEFSIILDINNRIYTSKGDFWNPDKSSINVSAKHSEIDIQRQNLKADFQNINKVSKRIEWSTIAKYAFMIMLLVSFTILMISGMSRWGDAQASKAIQAQAESQTMIKLGEIMETVAATVNTQKLEILPMMREIYKTENIGAIINEDIINNNIQNVST